MDTLEEASRFLTLAYVEFSFLHTPESYTPMFPDINGHISVLDSPYKKKIDCIEVRKGHLPWARLFSLDNKNIWISSSSWPRASQYGNFFRLVLEFCEIHRCELRTIDHSLSERNRRYRSRATCVAHYSGRNISLVQTNTAQLIGLLPYPLRSSYGGDLSYYGAPVRTHIKLSVQSLRLLRIIRSLVDKMPRGVKAYILKVAANRSP